MSTKNILSRHINEMSPELLRRAAQKQKERLKDTSYQKQISAYEFIQKLRRADDFEKYAQEIVRRINAENGNSDDALTEQVKIVPQTIRERKLSLKSIPFEVKFANSGKSPVIPFVLDPTKTAQTEYVVIYLSSIDDNLYAVTTDARSQMQAVQNVIGSMFDIKEIKECLTLSEYNKKPATMPEKMIDPSEYDNNKDLADGVASTLTDGEFNNYREFVADVKDDQTTERSANSPIYEGEDVEGNKWTGRKASMRRTAEENGFDFSKIMKKPGDVIVELITKVADQNTEDEFIDARTNPEVMRKTLYSGIVHFVFMKKDGSERQAFGTTNPDILESNGIQLTPSTKEYTKSPMQVRYFDLTSRGWRSFVIENLRIVYDEGY